MGKWWFKRVFFFFYGGYSLVIQQFTIETGHRDSKFCHEKWWLSIAMLDYQSVIWHILMIWLGTYVKFWFGHRFPYIQNISHQAIHRLFVMMMRGKIGNNLSTSTENAWRDFTKNSANIFPENPGMSKNAQIGFFWIQKKGGKPNIRTWSTLLKMAYWQLIYLLRNNDCDFP